MRNISGRIIAAALGLAPSAVDVLIRDKGFRPLDRTSNLPGRGRDWSFGDLIRVCLAVRLSDIGLGGLDAIAEIPQFAEIPADGTGYFVADIFDMPLDGGAGAPQSAFVRLVEATAIADVFDRGQGQVVVIPIARVLRDVRAVQLLAREAA